MEEIQILNPIRNKHKNPIKNLIDLVICQIKKLRCQLFVANSRRRIQETIEDMLARQLDSEFIVELGENLATLLGEVIETKIKSRNLFNRLKKLS